MTSRGKTLGFRALVLALGLFLAASLRAGGQAPELVTNRPDQTESSETVGPGYVQFEFGWTHSEDNEDGEVTSDSLPETLVRVGVADGLELRFGFDGFIREDAD